MPELDDLPGQVGFIETDDLAKVRDLIVSAAKRRDHAMAKALFEQYHIEAEHIIDRLEDSVRPRAQIGLILTKAIINRDTGRVGAEKEEIQDAAVYARNMGYDELASQIELFERSPR